jgi:hypothetical protein
MIGSVGMLMSGVEIRLVYKKLFDRKRNFELENLAGYLSHIDTMLTN